MQNWHSRDDRKTVRIKVRVRTDSGWTDATVHNVSNHGLMLHSLRPLRTNEFIEVARGPNHIVGRVVWSDGAGCGLRTQDQVDIASLLGQPIAPGAAHERRQRERAEARPTRACTIEEQVQSSRALGQSFERVLILIVGAAVSLFAADSAYQTLASPLHEVEEALGVAPH